MKQKSKFLFLKKIFFIKSLVAIFATGLFAFSDEEYDKFILGRSFFVIPWVEAPSVTSARDGLGPLFNANSCISCHPANGRGTLYNKEEMTSRSLVARLSTKSNNSKEHLDFLKYKGYVPHKIYGSQLSINSVHGVNFEGKIKLDFNEIEVLFPDGEKQILLKPNYSLENLNYGSLDEEDKVSYRIAPTLNGMGLIELISNKDILKNEDVEDIDGDGISGKANYVYSNITKKIELGKYTWKASVASLKEQIANAALNDMGLTTSIFPNDNCTKFQKECMESPTAKDSIDLPDERLDAITFYLKNLEVYNAKNIKKYKEGLEIFEQISCSKCHISSFETIKGKIHPYSDFLLHDMGDGLSDGRVEFGASENEWRTAPLWGLSQHEKINNKKPRLLHDGRARNFQEAILWHGGEALQARENYMNLPKEKREKLIKFLEEL